VKVPVIFLAVAVAACSSDTEQPTATPATSATKQPTEASSTAALEPIVRSVNEAILAGDPVNLESLIDFESRPCDSNRIQCPDGVAIGTMVDTFTSGFCGEGGYPVRGTAELRSVLDYFVDGPLDLYAVVQGSALSYATGIATLVYEAPEAHEVIRWRAAVVGEDGLVATRYSCGIGVEQWTG
jgi:hypothetical protein